MTLEYPSDLTINGVSFATLAQKVQANLQAAGFRIRLAGSPVTTFQPKFRADKVAFGLWLYAFDYPDPVDYQVFVPGELIALHAGWQRGSDPSRSRSWPRRHAHDDRPRRAERRSTGASSWRWTPAGRSCR